MCYKSFCQRLGLEVIPTSEEQLLLFVTELAKSRAVSTIRCYLAAVRHFHIVAGFANPLEWKLRLQLALKGIQRIKPTTRDTRLPITPLALRAIRGVLAPQGDFYSHLLWAARILWIPHGRGIRGVRLAAAESH